ncbi:MAG: type II toxin-antitoxin system HicB family antitoxin [Acidimicrobiales bacterium]|nr:type II toxin-antitoxin system HicB family antitoxin [Acidimicrobiia bacterium]NNF52878.1 type II toxin-antitoxin system HicB family antitoxin [Acidimicrobiales bacterium]NNL69478.1 type II toxin-antitoxin system HicB family antitoxin [Acidimicrobiia bacterium]
MSDYSINVFFSEEDGAWVAVIPDLPGCSAFGDTPEQAVAEVGVAKLAWLETAVATGKPVPAPTDRSASASG